MEKLVQHTSGGGNREPDSEEHYNFDGILDEKAEIKYAPRYPWKLDLTIGLRLGCYFQPND